MDVHDIQSECDRWLVSFMGRLHQADLQDFMVTPLEYLHIYKQSICDRMCSENHLWKYSDIIFDEDSFTMDTLTSFWKNNTEVT